MKCSMGFPAYVLSNGSAISKSWHQRIYSNVQYGLWEPGFKWFLTVYTNQELVESTPAQMGSWPLPKHFPCGILIVGSSNRRPRTRRARRTLSLQLFLCPDFTKEGLGRSGKICWSFARFSLILKPFIIRGRIHMGLLPRNNPHM